MAVTRLTDLIIPSVFAQYMQVVTSQLNVFQAAGILAEDPRLSALLGGGARRFDVPFFKDLDDTESNISNDNPASLATPRNITTGKQVAQRHNRNQSWSDMDLNQQLAGADPMGAIVRRVAGYWARQRQRMLIATCRGLFADNITNDSGDMVKNIAIGSSGTPGAQHMFNGDAFVDTCQTMGDNDTRLQGVAMHSVVYARAKKNNLIDFIPDSRGEVEIPTYQGKRVIVDDGLPVVTNGSNTEYHTYVFGSGPIGLGTSAPPVPVETDRIVLAGGGGGQEVLVTRVQLCMHPYGFEWTAASQSGESPTFAELATAANWNRVYPERKQIHLALLISNG